MRISCGYFRVLVVGDEDIAPVVGTYFVHSDGPAYVMASRRCRYIYVYTITVLPLLSAFRHILRVNQCRTAIVIHMYGCPLAVVVRTLPLFTRRVHRASPYRYFNVFVNVRGWISPLQKIFSVSIRIQVGNFCLPICIYILVLQLLSIVGM